MEYDGSVPRRWAEAQARLTSCPFDVSYRVWGQLRERLWRVLRPLGRRGGGDLLGWSPPQPYSPIAKHLGLIWKLNGDVVTKITRDTIVINGTTLRRRMLQ